MTIFNLLVYSCVTLTDFSGDLISKTCNWRPASNSMPYARKEVCEAQGQLLIGTPIFSDVYEDRRVDKFKCDSRSVFP